MTSAKGHSYLLIVKKLLLIFFVAYVSGCIGKKVDEPLRIAINPWPGYELLFLAQEKGFFREQGLNVQLVEYGSLGDVQRSFEWGQVNGFACSLMDVLLAKKQTNRNPKIVLITSFPTKESDVLLAHCDVNSITELKGKRIGLEYSSLGIYVLIRALEYSKMTLEDVKVVPCDPTSLEDLIDKGHVDAVICSPPYSVKIRENKHFHSLFSNQDIPGEVLDVIAFEEKVIHTRPNDIVKFLKVWERSVLYFQQHTEEAYELMARRENISLKDFEGLMANVTLLSLQQQVRLFRPTEGMKKMVHRIQKHSMRAGLIGKTFLTENDLFAPELLESAIAETDEPAEPVSQP
ncbi:MAG: hypothetical protein A2007_03270 [Verrucomicrobia bacterium GWC2_42_7]|nr:MAG: hypothetical protein A2007_03270 [Verrucomicrobia bacterium GWC2_42_7]